jgi:hypothetical protein
MPPNQSAHASVLHTSASGEGVSSPPNARSTWSIAAAYIVATFSRSSGVIVGST